MLTKKYTDRIVTGTGFESTHVMKTDQNRTKDFFAVDCTWYWRSEPNQIVEGTRVSEANQVLGLVGADQNNPFSLAGEITIWVDGKKNILNKSSLIFVPAGVTYGPIQINHMEHPINYAAIGIMPDPKVKRDPSWPRYTIISETKEKAETRNRPPPDMSKMTSRGARLLHMEDDLAKGSFYVDYVWLYEGFGAAPMGVHDHEWEELIAMTGCDPEHPYAVGGTFSIDLAGETHMIKQSSLVCIPAHTMHCPWKFIEINKPTLAFTASPSGMYYSSEKKQW